MGHQEGMRGPHTKGSVVNGAKITPTFVMTHEAIALCINNCLTLS